MKKTLFFILLFVNAKCSYLPNKLVIDIQIRLNNSTNIVHTSVDQLSESIAKNQNYINDFQNQSPSYLKMFESKLDELQKNLTERAEQIVEQKFETISEDHQKTINELQTQMNEEHSKTSSVLMKFGLQLDSIQKNFLQFKAQNLVDDCSDFYNVGLSKSYLLQKFKREVHCDMDTDGGGWLVIQKRRKLTNQVDFNRTWVSYKEGFGDLDTEFWIGNEFLHRITNQKPYELRIDMEDFENGTFYATYSEFRVGNEESGYKLHIGGYQGNVRDRLSYNADHKFSTFDRDNDGMNDGNCAIERCGGFWYDNYVNLYGVFPTVPERENKQLIRWYNDEENLILIKVEMKIRPKKEQ